MRIYLMLALSLLIGKSTFAEEVPQAVTKTAKVLQQLIKADSEKLSLNATPIAGLYEAMIGGEVIYISADGRHFVAGNLFETDTRRNLTEETRNQLRIDAFNALDESEMVVFAPEKETQYTVNVFTDVDCPYCSKFHNEVPALNKAGVKVRYFAFPRAGVGSKTYKTMVSVWCAEDRQQAMTDAKARQKIKTARCKNPVAKQYKLGQRIGITGTPALVLSDGELVPGYVPAKQLISHLRKKSSPFSGR
ncbi:MAG: DsbC family protein [Pseudomonadota bacterium]